MVGNVKRCNIIYVIWNQDAPQQVVVTIYSMMILLSFFLSFFTLSATLSEEITSTAVFLFCFFYMLWSKSRDGFWRHPVKEKKILPTPLQKWVLKGRGCSQRNHLKQESKLWCFWKVVATNLNKKQTKKTHTIIMKSLVFHFYSKHLIQNEISKFTACSTASPKCSEMCGISCLSVSC